MDNFTFENNATKNKLETYEWDNVWIEHAGDKETPTVLYIGDSISCGTRRTATAMCEEKYHFSGFGTSKSLDNPYYKEALLTFSKQLPRIDCVIFNNGLHGWHLDDTTEYRKYYEEMVDFILDNIKGVPLVIMGTTYIESKPNCTRVPVRNKVAEEIALQKGLSYLDIYSVTKEYKNCLKADGVHFEEEGYKIIAKTIIEKIDNEKIGG